VQVDDLAGGHVAGRDPVPDLRKQLHHGLMQAGQLLLRRDRLTAQLPPRAGHRPHRLSQLSGDRFGDLGKLHKDAPSCIRRLGEQAMRTNLLLALFDLPRDLRQESLELPTSGSGGQTHRLEKARQQAHLGGMRDRRFLRRRVRDRELRIRKAELHGQLDHVFVD
jgi:hypothetical protein